jgi:hypothetical protein
MQKPPEWTATELDVQVRLANANFRSERLREPLENWKTTFDIYHEKFEKLFDAYGITDPRLLSPERLVEILKDGFGEILRYLAGPPISEDDLVVLADATLTPSKLASAPEAAQRVIDILVNSVDPRRFPWIAEKRPPREDEKAAAILASAVLITAQRVATSRRIEGKDAQEKAVKAFLTGMGFVEDAPRTIRTLTDAPEKGHFCCECLVGSRKADVPVRLHDGRLMPIECKVSNSALNSVKRINNDAAVKAKIWRDEFGKNQVVPVAVLSGVFNVPNLVQAQENGLTLFWAHRLDDMKAFILSAK